MKNLTRKVFPFKNVSTLRKKMRENAKNSKTQREVKVKNVRSITSNWAARHRFSPPAYTSMYSRNFSFKTIELERWKSIFIPPWKKRKGKEENLLWHLSVVISLHFTFSAFFHFLMIEVEKKEYQHVLPECWARERKKSKMKKAQKHVAHTRCVWESEMFMEWLMRNEERKESLLSLWGRGSEREIENRKKELLELSTHLASEKASTLVFIFRFLSRKNSFSHGHTHITFEF